MPERRGSRVGRQRDERDARRAKTEDRVPDRAPDLPGTQLNDPDVAAKAAVHTPPIHPQRRGGGPR